MKKVLNFKEIDKVAEKLADYVQSGDVVALIGDLGTGKTTFTKKFAETLGVTDNLKSPTFNYVLEYFSGRLPLYHFDVYRLGEAEEIYEVGYEDYLGGDGVMLIEWADIIQSELPKEYIRITLEYDGDETRGVSLEYVGNKEKEEEMLEYVGFSD